MTIAPFTIDEPAIPEAPGAAGWADFGAATAVRNDVEAEAYGTRDLALSTEEILPYWLNQEYSPARMLVARVDGKIVARGVYETLPGPDCDVAWLEVEVLPAFRRRGIGTALADRVESIAAQEGRVRALVYVVSREAPGDRLPAPTGSGSVPLINPEVRFLLARGYTLEQVYRGSRLALPLDDRELARHLDSAAQASGPEYAVHRWTDRTPERWLDDMALLRTRMSTDAPSAGLEEPENAWTAERVVVEEEAFAAGPRTALTAVVEHLPSGRLAGFTELAVPAEASRAVHQQDTLVLKEHRGHRLGMLLKVANLQVLEAERPGHPSVITFNAEENRHMLDVNEALGFVPIGYEGAWKRVGPGPAP
ncbi:MAG: GNAT family N-acetyltransferase [Cryobacterium sp.]